MIRCVITCDLWLVKESDFEMAQEVAQKLVAVLGEADTSLVPGGPRAHIVRGLELKRVDDE